MNKKFRNRLSAKHRIRNVAKAQSLVEFALILPVLLLTVVVLIELARVMHAWLAVENGARAGVRYAVTAEYNPENCGVAGYDAEGKCINEADEAGARVASIHEAAWSGSSSIVRVGIGEADPDKASYFNVIVCDPEDLIVPGATFDAHSCPPEENPGSPGEQVIIVVEFNHPVLMPFLNTIWPELRLTARREATVETYRVPLAVGTAPIFNSPTPKATNTPGPTPPPDCGQVKLTDVEANPASGWVSLEYSAYEEGELYPGASYQLELIQIRISLSVDARINKFKWMTWNEAGGEGASATETNDPYSGAVSDSFTFTPSGHFLDHCYPGGCPGYHYRGELTTYTDRPLGKNFNYSTIIKFVGGPTCDFGWRQYHNPIFPEDTDEPYETNTPDPDPDPTETPSPTWEAPVPSDTPGAPPD